MQNQANGRSTDYLPHESEHNGNGDGNGHHPTPSEKAWDTARKQAVEKATGPFYDQLDEEVRALCDSSLAHGAARLFCLIAKLSWKPEVGGRHRGRVGSLCISARKLAKIMACSNVKSFFHKKKRDPETKKILSQQDGWIESLVNGGYLWTAKCPIRNIPEDKWQNVYNVACHVPRAFTPELGLLEGIEVAGEGAEEGEGGAVPRNGNREFLTPEAGGNGQSPENRTASPPKRALPVPRNGHGQSPETVYKGETGDGEKAIQTLGGEEAPPWDREFARWKFGLQRQYPKELRATLEDLKGERTRLKEFGGADAPEQLRRVKLKIDAVNVALNGPK